MKQPMIQVISNGQMSLKRFSEIASTIEPYVDVFHLREKARTARELSSGISELKKNGISLEKMRINDRVDVAKACHVSSVQLAYHSLTPLQVKEAFPDLYVSKSVHSVEEAIEAENEGVDELLFGHIFSTQSKPGKEPRGLEGLQAISSKVSVPVIAIGGITPHNCSDVIEAGASGIALMSGILNAEDPLSAVLDYRERVN
ncbi:thiamine phosphate synthase [Texcoconibacillus texcoconensis]|uniref:Thiazole tautomerase (Transcriptional regulator TenI) n=1 Tax=Texcoconibacillus texcoconensis TaxID=1095777 RepID=A0A840QLP3_9BACI|nr:thiamine phosphate synthase [Texcoconibacillus texcoconensis]MBB5172292.1 thiazole tautomerase (transcriptional regulator TenI) [Texcoconibacillus texcoconensis]